MDATEAADELGFYTVLMTNNQRFLEKRTTYPHVHEMILVDLEDHDAVIDKLEILKKQGKDVHAVISFINPYVLHAARLGEELGLPAQTARAIECMLHKIAVRELLRDTSYSIPFQVIKRPEDEPLLLKFPVVVKCPSSTGSKDVLLVDSYASYESNVAFLQRRYPDSKILVEEFIPGQQYLVEVLVHNGEPHIVAVVEQTISSEERFIITGYCIMPVIPQDILKQIKEMVETVTERTGMEVGGFHVEFKVSNGTCKIIEVNPRISGAAMNRMIQYAYGINLAKETIRSLLGEAPDLTRKTERYVYAHYITVERRGVLQRVTGKEKAMKSPFVVEVYVKPHKGATLQAPRSMGHRYAYVITAADSAQEAKHAAMQASSSIKFHLATV